MEEFGAAILLACKNREPARRGLPTRSNHGSVMGRIGHVMEPELVQSMSLTRKMKSQRGIPRSKKASRFSRLLGPQLLMNPSGWALRKARNPCKAKLPAHVAKAASCGLVALPTMATFTLIAARKDARGGWNEKPARRSPRPQGRPVQDAREDAGLQKKRCSSLEEEGGEVSLYEILIARLVDVNNENQTEALHRQLEIELYAWKDGVRAACRCFGRPEPDLNGDYYYIDLGIDRPMCCGVFLDWKCKLDATASHPHPTGS